MCALKRGNPDFRVHTFTFVLIGILHRLVNDTANSVCRLPLHPLGGVGVGIQREPRAVVAQGVREGFHIYTVLQRQGGEGMPKLVEAENEGILVEVENGT